MAKKIIVACLLVFYGLTLFWLVKGDVFVSPDENAAFVFARTLAKTGSLVIPEPLNENFAGLLHPRSALGFGASIVPGGFLGFLVLTGTVAAIFGSYSMFIVTPLLAILAIFAWRDFIQKVFSNQLLANLAAFFLAIHPAFWYYTGRVMMHNVAFLAFIVFALWFGSKGQRWLVASGLCLGMALFIRPVEAWWLVPSAITLALVTRTRVLPIVFGILPPIILMLVTQQATFGSLFTTGYTAHYAYEITGGALETSLAESSPWSLVLPFGFHEMNILKNLRDYVFGLYPWMTIPAILGLVMVILTRELSDRRWQVAIALGAAISLWLIVLYGSWLTVDNPDPTIASLANSHVRYWLPIFVVASLYAAQATTVLWSKYKWGALAVLGLCFTLSAQLVFFGHDGFVPTRAALDSFAKKREIILLNTEEQAIIIVDRADKYLFPYRRVVTPLRSEETYNALSELDQTAPLYYFGITLPEEDFAYLREIKLLNYGVLIEQVLTVDEESLYRLRAH